MKLIEFIDFFRVNRVHYTDSPGRERSENEGEKSERCRVTWYAF